jgi:hypothetical protein
VAGSAGLASWIAQIAFWALIILGVGFDEVDRKTAALFVALWLAGYAGASFVPGAAPFLTSYLAILDLVLVFLVFKGDVRMN